MAQATETDEATAQALAETAGLSRDLHQKLAALCETVKVKHEAKTCELLQAQQRVAALEEENCALKDEVSRLESRLREQEEGQSTMLEERMRSVDERERELDERAEALETRELQLAQRASTMDQRDAEFHNVQKQFWAEMEDEKRWLSGQREELDDQRALLEKKEAKLNERAAMLERRSQAPRPASFGVPYGEIPQPPPNYGNGPAKDPHTPVPFPHSFGPPTHRPTHRNRSNSMDRLGVNRPEMKPGMQGMQTGMHSGDGQAKRPGEGDGAQYGAKRLRSDYGLWASPLQSNTHSSPNLGSSQSQGDTDMTTLAAFSHEESFSVEGDEEETGSVAESVAARQDKDSKKQKHEAAHKFLTDIPWWKIYGPDYSSFVTMNYNYFDRGTPLGKIFENCRGHRSAPGCYQFAARVAVLVGTYLLATADRTTLHEVFFSKKSSKQILYCLRTVDPPSPLVMFLNKSHRKEVQKRGKWEEEARTDRSDFMQRVDISIKYFKDGLERAIEDVAIVTPRKDDKQQKFEEVISERIIEGLRIVEHVLFKTDLLERSSVKIEKTPQASGETLFLYQRPRYEEPVAGPPDPSYYLTNIDVAQVVAAEKAVIKRPTPEERAKAKD